MEMSLIFCIFLWLSLFQFIHANECANNCDLAYPGDSVTFCGTDLKTYSSSRQAIGYCYTTSCDIGVNYPGPCGCPNNCFSNLGKGECTTESSCKCHDGWKGDDCSLPACPGNTCSGHGRCIIANDAISQDYCECTEGYTASDCSEKITNLNKLPWGELFGSAYGGEDEYQDNHPAFNLSILPTIHISMSEEDYLYTQYPHNMNNQSYVHANFTFLSSSTNQQIITLNDVGIHIKGATTRQNPKKGWAIKFNEFSENQNFFGMKKIGLKTGCDFVNVQTLVKSMLMVDFTRALGLPTYRASYVRVYINEMFSGIYFIHEDIGKDFMISRFDDENGSGDFYKFMNVYLEYFGNDLNNYPSNQYEHDFGHGNLTELIDLLHYFNATTDKDFEKNGNDYLGMNNFIHWMIIESFVQACDNMQMGRNYGIYHRTKSSKEKQWQIIEWDYDSAFYVDSRSNESPQYSDIYQFWELNGLPWPSQNIVPVRILSIPSLNETFKKDYQTFLSMVFGKNSAQQPIERFQILANFVRSSIANDQFLDLCAPYGSEEEYNDQVSKSMQFIQERYEDVKRQLQM